jgi:hypothetical protein
LAILGLLDHRQLIVHSSLTKRSSVRIERDGGHTVDLDYKDTHGDRRFPCRMLNPGQKTFSLIIRCVELLDRVASSCRGELQRSCRPKPSRTRRESVMAATPT